MIIAAACVLLVLCMGAESGEESLPNDVEGRMQRILSQIEGAGEVSVMLSWSAENQPAGALVTASGADDVRVTLLIQQAVRTLTGLELSRIEVVKSGR